MEQNRKPFIQYVVSVDNTNDTISQTHTYSCAGGIHQVETSNLQQVCAVKRVW